MPSLLPWRMPAWLAEVCDGSSASHESSRIARDRIQRGEIRKAAGSDLGLQDRVGEPVDLDDDEARLQPGLGLTEAPPLGGVAPDAQLADEGPEVRLVLVDGEHGRSG